MDAQITDQPTESYQGQFGEFTITDGDRQGVKVYRGGLLVAALSFAIGTALVFWQGSNPKVLVALTPLYTLFAGALAVSLLTIHIYMGLLHRALQIFWVIGAIAAISVAHLNPEPFALTVYQQPLTILGIGFTFAALTGIFFKEAFCFNRLETKFLTFIVPALLLGHLTGLLPIALGKGLLAAWAILFMVFALRKTVQAIPDDIGDKSVFEYLKHQRP
ncbi:MAG: DUF2301 domain-containing membrane protein [Drouetiella hepatica Uher 2000/2452]|uniref:DUF2301 domain-containing membrane protein n=1 Tax=Drouetiella hepatica Uher 2000/2452 TaxID=904376 RepID=A0A951QEK7_9CYAN|nr:DUF2301 domain-containing membrane protein [Drouetiella hepatica Uher 2000/2452]